MSQGDRRYEATPKSVPGEFYVEDGCCTLYGIPQHIAPNLFSIIENSTDHCYVTRQLENERELAQMLDTIAGVELQCIRYAGTDRAIQARIATSSAAGAVCDNLLPELAQRGFVARLKQWVIRALGKS